MKFTLKNIEFVFDGWKAEFKQIKTNAYTNFTFRSNVINRDLFSNVEGNLVVNTNELTSPQLADFMELEEKFLASCLVKAKNDELGELVESEDQKELFINWLLDVEEFKTFKEGYMNGPKKT